MKRSSESAARDGVFLIQSLTKTLCSLPEESDLKKQASFHQEDDSGIKSGNKAGVQVYCCPETLIINASLINMLFCCFPEIFLNQRFCSKSSDVKTTDTS